MKRILFIIYTHTAGGGAEKILTNIVNNLDKKKYDISIVEYANYHIKTEELQENIHRLPSIVDLRDDGKIKRLAYNICVHLVPELICKKRIEKKYDIGISFNYQIPNFLLKALECDKKIAWIHGDVYDLKTNFGKRYLQKKSFLKMDKIIGISKKTIKSLNEIFPECQEKIQLIYNGYEFSKLKMEAKKVIPENMKKPSILYIGRLEPGKRPLELLEVIRKLKEKGKQVYLYYLGKGDLEDELRKRISVYGLEDEVKLLGFQKNPYPYIQAVSAICMMSKSEGFPTVFVEGMTLGIPFISTPVGGTDELSNNGKCGIIVETIEECVNAIERVVLDNNVNTIMGNECINYVERFSMKNQIRQIEEILDKI